MVDICATYKQSDPEFGVFGVTFDGYKKHDYQDHKLSLRPYVPIYGTTTTPAPETTESLAELTAEEVLKKNIAKTNEDSQDIVM